MQYRMIMAATLAMGNFAYALPARPHVTQAPSADLVAKRQESGSGGSSVLDAPMTIAAGESFDGGNAIFDRGVDCTGQVEGGDSDAVFILEAGATLSNVRIGPNQIEGVHCNGGCTLNNVYWDAVCEDAFSIKKQADGETTTINGGGAKGAEDKVIQHNGGGTVIIKDFEVSDFGKLYRSCGNCKSMPARHVEISGGSATGGKMLVGINPNMGDTAKISGISVTDVKQECVTFNGVTDGSEPEEVGTCDGSGSGSTEGDAPVESAVPSASPTEGSGSDGSESAPVESAAPVETESGDNQDDNDNQDNQDDSNNDNQDNQDDSNNDESNNDESNNDDSNQDNQDENKDDSNNDESNNDNQDNQDDSNNDESNNDESNDESDNKDDSDNNDESN